MCKCKGVEKIIFSCVIGNNADISYMFSNCSSLNELNLSFFNTEKVNNMKYMFGECCLLKNWYF